MAHLTYLPTELHCAIASLLRPRDIVNLRASCKRLRVLLTEHENYIVHAIITYRYSFLVIKVPLPQERSSIDPEVHEAMKTNTPIYWAQRVHSGHKYLFSKIEYPQHFCQCASCNYAWQLIWEKAYDALWYDWVVGLDDPSERLAGFVVTRMQAFVVEITKSKLAYAYLLDYLLEMLARDIEQKAVRALEKDLVFSPVEALCQPTECHIPNLEPDPEFDCWIREHVDQDNSDRAAREDGFVNSISGEFAFLSDQIKPNKHLGPGLGHSILQYLAEMKVMIDHEESTIAHEASVQVRFGAEAAKHNAVVVWAPPRSERHLQVIQLRKKKLLRYITLSVFHGQNYVWF